jgi:hypothetical protein
MRKLDLVVVLLVVAGVSALAGSWNLNRTEPARTPKPSETSFFGEGSPGDMVTSSGRWKILPAPYQLADLRLGMTEKEVRSERGEPTRIDKQNGETQLWFYDAGLKLIFLDGRLLSLEGSGRWDFREGSKRLPGFMHSQSELLAALGDPVKKDNSSWQYQQGSCELTFQFTGERIQSVQISSQVQSMPRILIKTTTPVQVSP